MSARQVYLETFGCQMNELDSELVSGQLRAMGYTFTPDRDQADVVLYNTCSVREHAEQKVWSRLGEDRLRKLTNPSMVVGVLGCMAERDGTDLIKRMPVVDILIGPGELDKLPALLDNAVRTRESLASEILSNPPTEFAPENAQNQPRAFSANQVALQGNTSRRSATLAAAADNLEMLDLSRSVSPDDHSGSAYVRITRGCNKFCTYCVVPFTRGAEMHRPPRHIVDECKRLADAGVVEITLLGQTVNHYRFEHGSAITLDGITQPQKGRSYAGGHSRDPFAGTNTTTFADLLAMIHDEVPAIQRLRFVTSYPRDFGDDVLQVIRDHPRICRYLHVPPQSGSNRLLEKMNRGYTVEEYLDFLARARTFLHQPEIGRPLTIAGDIIVGFPTETDADFAATVTLLEKARFKNCFIFKYSPRPGTIAFDKLPDDVPEDVKRRRNNELLAVQHRVSALVGAEFVGQTLNVFVQGISKHETKRRDVAETNARAATGAVALTLGGKSLLGGPPLRGGESRGGSAGGGGGGGGGNGLSHASSCSDEATYIHDAADFSPTSPTSPTPATTPIQLSARTDGDIIVFFDAPPALNSPTDLIGRILPVTIDRADPLALHGRMAASAK